MNKSLFIGTIVSLSLVFSSCREERISSEIPAENPVVNMVSKDTEMKTQFAKALAKALKEHKELRDFIKSEALKQVNRDYDVLYHVIKNKPVVALTAMGGNTIHDLLLPYFETEAQLLEIESSMPLLTIFVPDLPEDSFSAESWDTMDEIPYVAVRTYESNDVPIYTAEGENFVLEAPYIPAFPVVVVKDNERVYSDRDSRYNNLDTRVLTEPTDDVQLRLADNNFDATLGPAGPPPPPSGSYPRLDPIHVQAYDAYKDYTPGGWQRDFIYYGLTPTNTVGVIHRNYKEYITSFKLTGDPQLAYQYISQHDQDPYLVPPIHTTNPSTPSQASAWTDGFFEIGFSVNYGPKESNVDANAIGHFLANPEDLFDITYTKQQIPVYIPNFPFPPILVGYYYVYTPHVTGLKMIDFYNDHTQKTEIETWHLNEFSNMWKISFQENDVTITHDETVTETNKYNTNLEYSTSWEDIVKIGIKFGASQESTQGFDYKRHYVTGSNDLGNSVINFGDDIVVPGYNWLGLPQLKPRKYNTTGNVEFEIRPRLIY
ncbi:MAG: hypothetical protein LBE36_05780 [Flavobacteriaceae bacterium]|jgi:hypothetical protein|nr:hypothetical protein [Flavobacteriaceae bacterium]